MSKMAGYKICGLSHVSQVLEVDKEGKVTKMESKWGRMGRYEHAPDDIPPENDPDTPQDDRWGTPEYWYTERVGAGDNKGRHTLKTDQHTEEAGCGCLGWEPLILFALVWGIKRYRKRLFRARTV